MHHLVYLVLLIAAGAMTVAWIGFLGWTVFSLVRVMM